MSRFSMLLLKATGPATRRRFAATCRSPVEAQEQLLAHILKKNAETAYGKDHGFGALTGFRDFQRRVPLSTYDDLEPYVKAAMNGEPAQLTREKPILFATTSGTTGASKYIPITPEGRSAKSRLMRVWMGSLYREHPDVVSGRILSVVSPEVELYAPCGTPCGAESGHVYRNIPHALKSMYSAPYEVFEIPDYEAKYYTILRLAVGQEISTISTANPSTVLLLAERLARHTESIIRDVHDGGLSLEVDIPDELRRSLAVQLAADPTRARALEVAASAEGGRLRPATTWPGLSVIACWKGGTVGSYLARFPTHFRSDMPVHDLGYLATELRGSVPLTDVGDAGVLTIGANVFEFLPADEASEPQGSELLSIAELEEGMRYFLYVTTLSGLYRYEMNDIIEVVGRYEGTPLVRFLQKGKGVVSFTGEKLYETQVLMAVDEAMQPLRGKYDFIAAVAQLAGEVNPVPQLIFLAEFDEGLSDAEGSTLAVSLDRALGRHNEEYRAKRASSRYGPPVIRVVRSGGFDRYRRRMVERGRADGQFKILRLTSDGAFLDEFETDRQLVATPST